MTIERPVEEAVRDNYTYYPHTSAVPEAVAVNVRGKSFKIVANIEITGCQRFGRNFCPWLHALVDTAYLLRTINYITSIISLVSKNSNWFPILLLNLANIPLAWSLQKKRQVSTMSQSEQPNFI